MTVVLYQRVNKKRVPSAIEEGSR